MQILIIDSAENTGNRIKSLLGNYLHSSVISQTNNVEDGWKYLKNTTPSMVILDADSYEPEGLQTFKSLRTTLGNSTLIMFTNYTHSMYKNACIQMGADFFFDKTTAFEQLIKLIEKNLYKNGFDKKVG